MRANQLRQAYIDFFKERGHLHLPGSPLIPVDVLGRDDPSTLFTSAGMQQFKPYFTGEAEPPAPRIVTVQKCIRTGDIDSVGDYSHCTFFEMLGNFSFGDYFKAEVIPWTWEFLVDRLGLDPDRLCVTVYLDDDEAYDIWHRVVGLPEDRIHRLGEDKNYWPANAVTEGPNGPCGPCTEVFYRVAPLEEMTHDPALTPTQRYKIDDAAGRWVEVWNNVFTQFNRAEDENGEPVLIPLPRKNNDTGAGFDRILSVVQNRKSVFETDLFSPVIARIEELSGRRYGGTMERQDFGFRVVAEHTRSAAFCIADGILPGSAGREYVLRRIMRRAVRFGKTALGFDAPFLHEVAPILIEQMGDFYPELVERQELILTTLKQEEQQFRRTLDNGITRLTQMLASPETRESARLSGEDAFMLYDTFGFPLELTQEIASESGMEVDLAGFEMALARQREMARQAAEGQEVFQSLGAALAEIQRTVAPSRFVGYTEEAVESRVLAIAHRGRVVESARAGDEVEIVLDRTPFYAESGGQVGDTGRLQGARGDVACAPRANVVDTQKSGAIILHRAVMEEGELHTGDTVVALPDLARRMHIRRNHTATHLLHAALREILGPHVHQKGSLVAPDRLRFDFTHSGPLSPDQLRRVEERVNALILADSPVAVHPDVPLEEARSRGAMALFGEKYGERVRMVEIPGFSLELCGGTHLERTSQVGLFKIVAETGVAAGVRRIEAVTGAGAFELVKEREELIEQLARVLKSSPRDVLAAAERLQAQRAQLEKQVQQLRASAGAGPELRELEVEGVRVVTGTAAEADAEALSMQADRAAGRLGSAIVVLGAGSNGKALFVAKVTSDLVKRGYHAGNLVREVAKIAGGGGGGRPDFAQAGGRDSARVPEALAAVPDLVRAQSAQRDAQ